MFIIKDRHSGEVIASGSEDDNGVITLEGCWYFLPEHVNMALLTETERTYRCPYKGLCHWIDIQNGEAEGRNIAFVYHNPMEGYEAITGRIAFYGRDTSATLAVVEGESR